MSSPTRRPDRVIIRRSLTAMALCVAALGSGCASIDAPATAASDARAWRAVGNAAFDRIARAETTVEKDRRAILAMQGDHRVDFHFMETVPLAPGYQRRDTKTTGGFETVRVLESTPDRIVLQHLLVTPSGQVIKHWRQDWTFEAEARFEFVADQTWAVVPLDGALTAGAWTQCVYEVSDAPRYCGTGRWNHRYGVSTWTSDRTWRPLPRREYTQRADYNVINAENRHTVTANGWTHEQDNTKVRRTDDGNSTTLVREFGFNDYRRIEGFDFGPADAYWARTEDYWRAVRAAWTERLAPGNELELLTKIDGMQLISRTFAQAEQHSTWTDAERDGRIQMLLDEWTRRRALSTDRGTQRSAAVAGD